VKNKFDVIIIGGGIIGALTAYELSKQNKKVLLLEKHAFGYGASGNSAAMLESQLDSHRGEPFSNIIGVPGNGKKFRDAAEAVHRVLPNAPFSHICSSEEAEMIKYAHNISGFMQVVTFNALYDLAKSVGADWKNIYPAVIADPMISNRYSNPVHKSGRGAGGACFIKDFAAFAKLYKQTVGKKEGVAFLKAAEKKNIMLLVGTNKDMPLLEGVYGKGIHKLKKSARAPKK
jgi:UDP-glucose 6-dehydrogenase